MKDLIRKIEKNFSIEEFVDPVVFKQYGQQAWMFLDHRLLETMFVIRTRLDRSITINNWKNGGTFTQRGLRTNISEIVKQKTIKGQLYLSAHCFGKAMDFDVAGMTSVEVRKWIVDNQDVLPYPIRMERLMKGKEINWCHLDVYIQNDQKVYLFNV
jgi:hypothetical protein